VGPRFGDPEQARFYLQATRAAFEHLRAPNLRDATTSYPATSMNNSYLFALKAVVNVVQISTEDLGPRPQRT
jgi:hypothetical protein